MSFFCSLLSFLGSLLFQLGMGAPGGGGGVLTLLRLCYSCGCFVEEVRSVAFDAQCSPGPANSL